MWSIIRFKPFSFNIENYEKWLEQKSEQGLILTKKIKGIHIFKREKSERVRYFLDINDFVMNLYYKNKGTNQTKIDKERLDYEELYKECGWTLVYKKNKNYFRGPSGLDIHLWKKAYTTEKPIALTDTDSLVKFHKRIMCSNVTIVISEVLLLSYFLFLLPLLQGRVLVLNLKYLIAISLCISIILYCLVIITKHFTKYQKLKREAIYKG